MRPHACHADTGYYRYVKQAYYSSIPVSSIIGIILFILSGIFPDFNSLLKHKYIAVSLCAVRIHVYEKDAHTRPNQNLKYQGQTEISDICFVPGP
jgi:hypothetical protein